MTLAPSFGAFGVCKARNDRGRQCASVVRSTRCTRWRLQLGVAIAAELRQGMCDVGIVSPLYYIITADDCSDIETFKRALSEREALERLEGGEPAGC